LDKLNIFVCENFSTEFNRVIESEGFDDVEIKSYYCICENKRKKADTLKLLQESIANKDEGLILCSKHCDIIKLVPEGASFKIRSSNFCFNHLANEQFINYILERGGYIIALGWLNNWRENIRNTGFDRNEAKLFYKEFCRDLVFFDAGIDNHAGKKLDELSEFLNLPYTIIPFELETIQMFIKSAVFEWRLHKTNNEYSNSIAEIQSQCAEYSAILDLIGKISSYVNKRDTIEKIKEIFIMILGAQQFKYWNSDYEDNSLVDEIKELFLNNQKTYLFSKEENRFCIKIQQNDKIYGAIDVSEFLFPQYIEKYLNFAIEISKVCGLVLSNIEQYEKLINSEKELQYLSFHDSLTGLYNRTYINEILNDKKDTKYLVVFAFDIDKLKYVNDNFGHLEGDKLICGVADILNNCFRETATVARIGGDEFVAILPECDMQMAEMFKNRINEMVIKNNKNKQAPHLEISVSVGFAISDDGEDTIETLIHKADELMYVDKVEKKSKAIL